jgi:glyoxylase-like metal-dependent hydrolase (beta-lactamase superfamily II)
MISWQTVAPGIERMSLRTPTLPPASETNSYLVHGREGFFLVEPATPYAKEQTMLFDQVQARISRGDMLIGALVTHHHVDHVGAAESFRTEFGVPLFAHATTRRMLEGRVAVDRLVEDGETLPGTDVRALHTPGHAPGHLCLWSESAKWLVAGDMVASVGTIVIDPDDEGDMAAYLAQLSRMKALRATRMLPAHGDPIDQPEELLAYYIAHRGEREAKVLAAVRDGDRDAKGSVSLGEVVRRAYADTPAWLWPLAAKSARAHLAKLVTEGAVQLRGEGWS